MDRFLSTHIAAGRASLPTEEGKELLADIYPDGSTNQPTLLFIRREPESAWERFTSWLLRPIQRVKARDHIKDMLNAAKKKDMTLAHLDSVQALESELESSSMWKGISLDTAKTAMLDLALRGHYADAAFKSALKADIEALKTHYLRYCHNETAHQGLQVLIDFAKNPDSMVSERGKILVTGFMKHLYAAKASGSTVDKEETGRMNDNLSLIYKRYSEVFESQPARIMSDGSETRPLTDPAKEQDEWNAALNTLGELLLKHERNAALKTPSKPPPKTENQGINAFKGFLNGSFPKSPEVLKRLLEEFIVQFADVMPRLDDNTIITLLPEVMRAAEFVFPEEFIISQSDYSFRISQLKNGLQNLAKAIASDPDQKATVAQACSYAWICYQEATAKDQVPLIHEPWARLKLYYAMYNGFELLVKLDPKDRPVAEAALEAMLCNWRDLAPGNTSFNSPALASQALIPGASESDQEFKNSTDISINDLYKHYHPFCNNDVDLERGLMALVSFAKNPDGMVNISEIVSVNNFMSQIGNRRTAEPEFQSLIEKIYDGYIEVPLSDPARVTEADNQGRQVPILASEQKKKV